MKGHISIILQICINEFSDNAYVINYNERILAAIEGTKILEEEHVVQSKLGDVWEPLKHDSNSQIKNSCVPWVSCEEIETKMVVHEMTMHSLEESITTQNMPTSSIVEIINNDKEYDKALDDGPNNPPNFEINTNL